MFDVISIPEIRPAVVLYSVLYCVHGSGYGSGVVVAMAIE